MKFTDPDEEGLVKFLCEEKNFSEERVRGGIKKILASKSKAKQGRLDSFFKVKPVETVKASPSSKRKSDGKSKGTASKRGKK